MAKLFTVDQTRADASKIVGTLGYMAPDYSISLPVPKRPAFSMNSTTETATMTESSSLSNQSKTEAIQVSVNEASISELDPRCCGTGKVTDERLSMPNANKGLEEDEDFHDVQLSLGG
ncbi:hypothetical protein V6N13_078286 [Hibiscus sabdariffa]